MVGGFGESLLVVRAELSGRKVDVPSIQFAAELITQMFRFPDVSKTVDYPRLQCKDTAKKFPFR